MLAAQQAEKPIVVPATVEPVAFTQLAFLMKTNL